MIHGELPVWTEIEAVRLRRLKIRRLPVWNRNVNCQTVIDGLETHASAYGDSSICSD